MMEGIVKGLSQFVTEQQCRIQLNHLVMAVVGNGVVGGAVLALNIFFVN